MANDQITLALKVTQKTPAERKELVHKERSVPKVLGTTETYDVDIHEETEELAVAKEPSLQLEVEDTRALTEVSIKALLPTVEAGDMHVIEGAVPVGTIEPMVEPVAVQEQAVEEPEKVFELEPGAEISPSAEQLSLEEELMSEKLTRQFTIKTYEAELLQEAPEIVSVIATEKAPLDTVEIRTAETEAALSTGESTDMQFIETRPVDLGADAEPEAVVEEAVVKDEITVELTVPEDTPAKSEQPVVEEWPVSEVLTKAVTTETYDVEIRKETEELEVAKEPSPQLEVWHTRALSEVQIEVSVPTVEAGDMHVIEGAVPVGTIEPMVEPVAVLEQAVEEPELVMELMPVEEISPPAEQPILKEELMSEKLTSQFTIETYEAELLQETPEIVSVIAAEKAPLDTVEIRSAEIEAALSIAESRDVQFIEAKPIDVSAKEAVVEYEIPVKLTDSIEFLCLAPKIAKMQVMEVFHQSAEHELVLEESMYMDVKDEEGLMYDVTKETYEKLSLQSKRVDKTGLVEDTEVVEGEDEESTELVGTTASKGLHTNIHFLFVCSSSQSCINSHMSA